MKRLGVLFLLCAAAASACTRSASTRPVTTIPRPEVAPSATPTIDTTRAALEASASRVAAQQTQAARPTQTASPTPMVFLDPDLTDPEKIEHARWVVKRDVVRPKTWEPLTFAPGEAYERGDMAMAIARSCLEDPVGEPLGFFTDLKFTVPAGANAEQIRQAEHNQVLAAVSEELGEKGLYLLRVGSAANDSESEKALQADEYLRWVELALTSPNCAGSKVQASEKNPSNSERISRYLAGLVVISCDNSALVARAVGVIPWDWADEVWTWTFDRILEAVLWLPFVQSECQYDTQCGADLKCSCENGQCKTKDCSGYVDNDCPWCCTCDNGTGSGTGPVTCENVRTGYTETHNVAGCLPDPTDTPPQSTNTPGPTNTVPPSATVPPGTTVPQSATPRPGGGNDGDDDKKDPTKTPTYVYSPPTDPLFCPDDALVGDCGLTRIQAAGLLHEDLIDWVFPPNQLPPPIEP